MCLGSRKQKPGRVTKFRRATGFMTGYIRCGVAVFWAMEPGKWQLRLSFVADPVLKILPSLMLVEQALRGLLHQE